MIKLFWQTLLLTLVLSGIFSNTTFAQLHSQLEQNAKKMMLPSDEISDFERVVANSTIKHAAWSLNFSPEYMSFLVNERDGTLYVSDTDTLRAYSADKKLLWSKPYSVGWSAIGPNDYFYASTCSTATSCSTYAIHPAGHILWTYPQRLSSMDVASDGSVYGLLWENSNYYFVKLGVNGDVKWKVSKPSSYSMSTYTLDHNDNVYMTDDIRIYKFDGQSGQISTFYSFPTTIQGMDLKVGTDGTVYAVDYGGTLYAIGANKQLKWSRFIQQGLISATPATNGDIYAKAKGGLATLYALSSSGQTKWKLGKYGYNGVAPKIGADGTIYDSAYLIHNYNVETHVYAVHPTTGKEIWQSPILIGESFSVEVSDVGIYHTTEHAVQFIETGIQFEDAQLEKFVRNVINKPTGTISANDVAHIEELDIGPQRISSLEGLQHFKNLKSLIVYGNIIKDLRPLQNLSKLEVLDISNNNIQDLTPIQQLTNLQILEFADNEIADVTALKDFTKLRFVDMASNFIESLFGLENLKALEALLASYNNIGSGRTINATTDELAPLQNLQQLQVLDLTDNDISSLSGIEKLKNLQTLEIAHNAISSITPLNSLTRIETIDISNNEIQSIVQLTNKSVKELNIAGNNIQNVQPLTQLTNLQTLNVRANPVKDLTTLNDSNVNVITDATNTSQHPDVIVSPTRQIYDSHKQWTIHLSVPVQKDTLTSDNVFVKNSKGETVATRTTYVEGSKKLTIEPPILGYESLETYTIYVQNVKGLSGKTIQPIQMSFHGSFEWKDDERTAMALPLGTILTTSHKYYKYYSRTMTAIRIYKSYRKLENFMERDEFTVKFLLEDNFKEDGSGGHIMNAVHYLNTNIYNACTSQNGHFRLCLDVLNDEWSSLPDSYYEPLMEDLIEEIISLKSSISRGLEDDKTPSLTIPYPNFETFTQNGALQVNVEVPEIEAYQQFRANNPFIYHKWNLFIKDIKITAQFGSNMKVGEEAQFSAFGHGYFLGREYVALDLTHLMDTLWVSHNLDIATVNENGHVIAKQAGTVKIQAMHGGKLASFTLVITN